MRMQSYDLKLATVWQLAHRIRVFKMCVSALRFNQRYLKLMVADSLLYVW